MQSTKRRLALLLGAALATMAFGASSASAATEVFDGATEEACSEVQPAVSVGATPWHWMSETGLNYSSGGCTVHITGAGYVASWAGGGTNSCDSSFDVHVGPDGWGYVDNVQFSNCSLGSAQACPGDRFVAPAEYNPSGTFKYANGETDLNAALCAYMPGKNQKFWGMVSFRLGSLNGTQTWENQQTAAPHGTWYHHTGFFYSTSNEESLIVTH